MWKANIKNLYSNATDRIAFGEFNYINKQSDTVKIYCRRHNGSIEEEYLILPGETLTFNSESYIDKDQDEPEKFPPSLNPDSLVVIMLDTFCIREYEQRGAIFQNNNYRYRYERIGKANYRFFFDIDSTLLPLAKICK